MELSPLRDVFFSFFALLGRAGILRQCGIDAFENFEPQQATIDVALQIVADRRNCVELGVQLGVRVGKLFGISRGCDLPS